jgi:hypothetical protein
VAWRRASRACSPEQRSLSGSRPSRSGTRVVGWTPVRIGPGPANRKPRWRPPRGYPASRQRCARDADRAGHDPVGNSGHLAGGYRALLDTEEDRAAFDQDLGLYPVLEESNRLFFKGWDEWDHHSLVLEEGGVGAIKFGFKVLSTTPSASP